MPISTLDRNANPGTAQRISALPFSNRTRARLDEAGIDTVEALLGMSDEQLLALRGFGHTCLREVRSVLRVARSGSGDGVAEPGRDAFPSQVEEPLLSTPLAHLPISNRARGVFERNNIESVADYVELGRTRLLQLRNFGETSLTAVNQAIHAARSALATNEGEAKGIFHHPESLTSDARVERELAQVPVAALDLPRRARRVCQQLGLRTLRDLTRTSSSDLLTLRNFGQATLRRIQSEMDRFLEQFTVGSPDSFASLLDQLLGRLQEKERRLVELREGRHGDRQLTLTEAGTEMEITESRACQIEHSAWAKLRRFSAGATEDAARQLIDLLMRHGGVARAEALSVEPFFGEGDLPVQFMGRMLARLLPHRIARLTDGRLAAVPGATLNTLTVRLRKRLGRSRESLPLDALTEDVLRGLEVGEESEALVQAVCEVLFHREVVRGSDGRMVVRTPTQGLGDDLRQILLGAGRPLHFTEIARRLALPPYGRTELTEEKVRLRLCRDQRFVLVRRGLYDLQERFAIDPSLKADLATRALALLNQAARPSSVALLGAELRRDPRFPGVSEFVLAAVLREDPRFKHLGRGTFVPAGSSETNVGHVSEILEEILTGAAGPLSYAELRQRVQQRRQVSDGAISATLVGRSTFLRVARGQFDLAERYPFDAERRRLIARDATDWIERVGGVASLTSLATQLEPHAAGLDPAPSPVLIGDLLRRQGGFRFLSGGFVTLEEGGLDELLGERAANVLREIGEPLRPTTIARRLSLGDGGTALLRRVLKEAAQFEAHADGRYSIRPDPA